MLLFEQIHQAEKEFGVHFCIRGLPDQTTRDESCIMWNLKYWQQNRNKHLGHFKKNIPFQNYIKIF